MPPPLIATRAKFSGGDMDSLSHTETLSLSHSLSPGEYMNYSICQSCQSVRIVGSLSVSTRPFLFGWDHLSHSLFLPLSLYTSVYLCLSMGAIPVPACPRQHTSVVHDS